MTLSLDVESFHLRSKTTGVISASYATRLTTLQLIAELRSGNQMKSSYKSHNITNCAEAASNPSHAIIDVILGVTSAEEDT